MANLSGAAPLYQSVHIDDLAQESHGSKEETFLCMIKAGGCFIACLQAMGMEVSSKSVILSSSVPMQRSLINFFRSSYGVELQPAGTAPHLGFARSSGSTIKPFSILKKRFSKADIRAVRVAWLARKSAKALSLFTTGVVPMATHGADHLGLNKSMRKHLDSMAVKAAGSPGFQGCVTTILHLKLGSRPSNMILLKVVSNFVAFWSLTSAEEKTRIHGVWDKARLKVTSLPASRRWRAVDSPLSATIACLLEAQWHPDSADRWLSPKGSFTYAIGVTAAADTIVLSELNRSFSAIDWASASRHFSGEGIHWGVPSFEGWARAKRVLTKEGKH